MGASNSKHEKDIAYIKEKNQVESIIRLVDVCFDQCVNSFSRRDLNKREKLCTTQCVKKFLEFTQRIEERIEEQSISERQKMETRRNEEIKKHFANQN
ncbi:import inner membrane translocase subunit tim9 [Anaeramoeba flamelloides]|uniref:Mitochondrial import inner membrane translocase subunit n=1 Tax=Anaeramoeba flamelloides TaxID=1746091 RepID=A0AAV7ZFG6_9EUKA|nr:import inner membrane translocase subunit tim9 [Anaeramoeba flamelloides]KAJ6235522.1 import inner membrane translocase subunit tim9 [Anaeramoeba flamelloides]